MAPKKQYVRKFGLARHSRRPLSRVREWNRRNHPRMVQYRRWYSTHRPSVARNAFANRSRAAKVIQRMFRSRKIPTLAYLAMEQLAPSDLAIYDSYQVPRPKRFP